MGAKFYETPQELAEFNAEEDRPIIKQTTLYPKFYNSNPKTIELLKLLIQQKKPQIFVETGIGNGISTKAILDAFKENNLSTSKLYSFDSDPRTVTEELSLNPQFSFKLVKQNNFQALMNGLQEIDFFYHDSDHSYNNQHLEYAVAWNKLTRGGILMSDDINYSNAFIDFCREINQKPYVLSDTSKFCGLLQK
jgi:predicted O-methyltransferase YrrM